MTPPTRKEEQGEETRARLVSAARDLFATRGFAETSTEQVVSAAGVTRGALYHHFEDKRDLFRAVFEEVERDLVARVAEVAAAEPDVWTRMTKGVRAFLEAAVEPDVQRVVLVDGPSVLGWAAWREIDEAYGYALVRASLQAATDEGLLPADTRVDALAHLFLASLSEAALQVARATDPAAAIDEMCATAFRMLEGLRAR